MKSLYTLCQHYWVAILLYILIVIVLITRIYADNTHYLSPDSHFYLECAQNIIEGKGAVVFDSSREKDIFFSIWPLGYPLCVALVAAVSGLSVFWASKVINILCVLICLLIFLKIAGRKSPLLMSVFGSFTFIEVFSYTWSEGLFLTLLLAFVFQLSQLMAQHSPKRVAYIALLGAFLFTVRYIGIIFPCFLFMFSIWFFLKNKKVSAYHLIGAACFISVFIVLYFVNNWWQTGDSIWGGTRILPQQESLQTFFWLLFVGLFNEVWIIRNYYFQEKVDGLFLLFSIFQLIGMGLIFIYSKRKHIQFEQVSSFSTAAFLVSMYYLLCLIILRLLSPFDAFDYRLLAPFSFLLYLGILDFFNRQKPSFAPIRFWIFIFFCVSLSFHFFKEFLSDKVLENF